MSVKSDYRYSGTRKISVSGIDYTYRITGEQSEIPLVLFNHLAGVLDNWDPRVINGLAENHMVVTFNNKGVGSSGGNTPKTLEEMGDDAIAFIKALGFNKIDMLGFSLGGAVAQHIILKEPNLIRKLILGGTGPKGGIGIKNIPKLCYRKQLKSFITFKDVLTYLFFTTTDNGKNEAKKFLKRLKERKENRDKAITLKSFQAQLKAIHKYGTDTPDDLSVITHPVLIANGEDDLMVPSVNSAHMHLQIPHSKLVLYKDAGHGGIFQYHEEFVPEALNFLNA
ncbi:alpha/beta fold hydrolase [Flagellimonas sp. CMM7]|uniref:alpha/beta fold hydrolase n=1 Tax=Flagellimonas sp. CMM7 TaxID=2654676 RepID=UPI0013D5951F|nr:alpha/beta hydrolase [Flagellimonas sp. CMM7]UII78771.1 alpha/beta hydrolase [Flagellimonas sp. CMM7]